MITRSISSKPHPPLKPTENYSLMVMESEHLVDGDGVDDDGGEDGVEIPLSGVESTTNLTPEMKIVVVAALCFANGSPLLASRFSGI